MIIDSSLVSMASSHSLVKEYQKTEELSVKVSTEKPAAEKALPGDKVSISDRALQRLEKDLARALKHLEKYMDKAAEHPEKEYTRAMKHLTKDLDKAITHLENYMGSILGRHQNGHHSHGAHGHDGEENANGTGGKQNWEVSYNMQESLYESGQMTFNSSGIVRTADGKEINFSLDLMMSRQYMAENKINLEASGTGNPGILAEFAGPASALSDTIFGFGIKPEGSGDSLSYLSLGSGLLTLDMNNNGQIDSLNELVGKTTGNGFAELAAYDVDGNGWIDENDPVYNSLQVLSQDSEGSDVLSGLKDSNIGAINLGSVASPYSLKNDQNATVGQIERSGLYLAEDGTPGQVQQLSMIV